MINLSNVDFHAAKPEATNLGYMSAKSLTRTHALPARHAASGNHSVRTLRQVLNART